MNNSSVVVIPIQRYNELLDIETRVDVVVEMIKLGRHVDSESILWTLGTGLAIDAAMDIRERERCKNECKN